MELLANKLHKDVFVRGLETLGPSNHDGLKFFGPHNGTYSRMSGSQVFVVYHTGHTHAILSRRTDTGQAGPLKMFSRAEFHTVVMDKKIYRLASLSLQNYHIVTRGLEFGSEIPTGVGTSHKSGKRAPAKDHITASGRSRSTRKGTGNKKQGTFRREGLGLGIHHPPKVITSEPPFPPI